MKAIFTTVLLVLISHNILAQTFKILDKDDKEVDTSVEFIDTPFGLSSTGFHIENTTTLDASFEVTATEILNETNVDLQICFAGVCFASAGNSSLTPPISELILKSSILTDFKIAPISNDWVSGDIAIWDMKIFNTIDNSDFVEVRVTWTHDGSVDIKELSIGEKIVLTPNPVSTVLSVETKNTISDIKIVDMTGKVVFNQVFGNEINVSQLEKGVYFIQFDFEGKKVVKRFLVI